MPESIRPGPVILTSGRLVLAPHTRDDFADSAALWADPAVTRHISGRPFSKEESWARLLRYAGHWAMLGFGFWAVRDKTTGRFVGEVGFADFGRDITPSLTGAEAGWVLAPWAHGQGYATEAMTRAYAWHDQTFANARSVCIIDDDNARSTTLAHRLGFRPYGEALYHDKLIRLYERIAPP